MLTELQRAYEDGGALVRARLALYDGDRGYVTAVVLHFEALTLVLAAVPEDDTLAVRIGPFEPDDTDEVIDVSGEVPWSACVGQTVSWAWQFTNQQGYTDGARFEFASGAAVELVVIGSQIDVFVPVRAAAR
jgi:Family of unknown function (DUF6334)